MSGKILVIEDERSIQMVIRTYLESSGYTVISADNGKDGLELCLLHEPDLVILDLNLPEMDGLEVAARIRLESEVYILMLTARAEEDDRIAGLRIGADDYLTKPFSPREMVARVEAILRRNRQDTRTQNRLVFKHVELDTDRHEVMAAGQLLDLTPTEFKLLWELMRYAGRVLNRNQLLTQVWGADFYGNDRVVDVYVGQVRRKLEEATGLLLIETIRGIGYKFLDEAGESKK
jgi:two-component system alkaline phosphatase synthesis response regulator PhoP